MDKGINKSLYSMNSNNKMNSIPNKYFITSIAILLTAITIILTISFRGDPKIIATNLENIPMKIAGYKATEDSFPEAIYKELAAQIHIYRHYISGKENQIDLYIGYYSTARGGRTGHNPNACFSGAGWDFIDSNKVFLKTSYYPNGVYVNYLRIKKGKTYQSILHWYQSAGTKVLESGFKQNIQRFFGRTFYNRNDGAFVRVSVSTDQEGIIEADNMVKNFAEKILELLPEYWPVEQ